MDYHEMYEAVLRYTIQCRRCGGTGQGGYDPCPVCLGSCVEAVTSSEKLTEDKVVAGLRNQVIWGGYDFINSEIIGEV